jgi:hypothetical protein
MTWNVAHSSPTGFSFVYIDVRQILSRLIGVPFSEPKIHVSGGEPSNRNFH